MPIFPIIELSSIIIFVLYLRHAIRHNQLNLLFYSAIFAFLFENLSIMLFSSEAGGYYYNDGFNIFIWETPLFIVLLWSPILYSAYNIVRRIVSGRAVFFLTPLFILSLDLVLDQVATHLGLWTWIGFESYPGIFSVPASNYIGWLMLPFFFFVTWEYFGNKKSRIFQPILAYLCFIIFSLPLHFLKINFFDDNNLVQYAILFILIVLFASLSFYFWERNMGEGKRDLRLFAVRIFLHLFTLIGIIATGLWHDYFILAIYFSVIIFEGFVFWKYTVAVRQLR